MTLIQQIQKLQKNCVTGERTTKKTYYRNLDHSPAMVKHCVRVIEKVVHKINPGQIPTITAYQPVYALHKRIPWKCSNYFGEDAFIVMGELHIELTMLHVLGLILLGPILMKRQLLTKMDTFSKKGQPKCY